MKVIVKEVFTSHPSGAQQRLTVATTVSCWSKGRAIIYMLPKPLGQNEAAKSQQHWGLLSGSPDHHTECGS